MLKIGESVDLVRESEDVLVSPGKQCQTVGEKWPPWVVKKRHILESIW